MTNDNVMTGKEKTRIAPHSKDSEMMVLGCMLTSVNAINIASEALKDTDFYFTEHKIIFDALKRAYNNDKPSDVHLICEELKRLNKLDVVGGAAYVTTLAQYAGTSAYIEEYVDIVREKALLRELLSKSQEIEKDILSNPDDPTFLIEKYQNDLKNIEQRHGKNIPIRKPSEYLDLQKIFLKKHRGKDLIGLRTSKISEFNTNLLGLRELMLLAAAPNVGKTALTIQLGIDVLENEKEACLIYISLEMSSLAIFNRMTLHFAEMAFNTFVLGSQKIQGTYEENFFTEEEFRKIKSAEKKLESFGERLQIIDSEICPFIDSKTIINYVEDIKSKTKCSRAIVVIDYLQVWPTPNSRFSSDIEADKWRIGEMKKIRDGIHNDPVIVISEARKPSDSDSAWGGDLSDVMGSARGTYTPDVVLLLNSIPPVDLKNLWKKMSGPKISSIWEIDGKGDKEGLQIKNFLAYHGIAFYSLKMDKGRDGMQKFVTSLAFHFRKNKFEKIKWDEIRILK